MGIDLNSLQRNFDPLLKKNENDLDAQIKAAGDNPTPEDLLKMQRGMERMTLMVQLESTTTKTLADALKAVVQKIG